MINLKSQKIQIALQEKKKYRVSQKIFLGISKINCRYFMVKNNKIQERVLMT